MRAEPALWTRQVRLVVMLGGHFLGPHVCPCAAVPQLAKVVLPHLADCRACCLMQLLSAAPAPAPAVSAAATGPAAAAVLPVPAPGPAAC